MKRPDLAGRQGCAVLGRYTATLALVWLLALSGCSVAGVLRNPFSDGSRSGGKEIVTIRIQNDHFQDATVFAIRDGRRDRLGMVVGKTRAEFTLDRGGYDAIYFEVNLIAGGSCVTDTVLVGPEAVVLLVIPPDIQTPCTLSRL